MSDPFRQVFLDHVKTIISKEPNRESLFELLKVATPSLDDDGVLQDSARTSAYRTLKLRIHPDKHPTGDTTALYQEMQLFYERCCTNLSTAHNNKKRKANPNSPPSAAENMYFPPHFQIRDKWPFLDANKILPAAYNVKVRDNLLAGLVVAQCLNARGAIAHGATPELHFSAKPNDNVEDAFKGYGGVKYLSTVTEIKKELLQNGPVVSTSFTLDRALLVPTGHLDPHSPFLMSRIGKQHELLIVGWTLAPFGEMWLAMPLNGLFDPFPIAFGQFGISDLCLAPKDSFENRSWQSGPYFDITVKGDEWINRPTLSLRLRDSDLCLLAEHLGSVGLFAAIVNDTTFVIRNKKKFAHSRRYRLNEVTWNKKDTMWIVSVARAT